MPSSSLSVVNSKLPEAIPALVDRAVQGDRRALSRLISRVEEGGSAAWSALSLIYPRTGQAQIIGVTGAPGTGKSTLVSEMAKYTRRHHPEITVGIVAVDPTSPFSGGAVLGDRIRMRDLSGDAGVFIRSMATRGSLGGLARATTDVVKVLDAAGFQLILIEQWALTGGIDGPHCRWVIVVEAPSLGDEVAIKAHSGIADILVVSRRSGWRAEHGQCCTMIDLGKSPARCCMRLTTVRPASTRRAVASPVADPLRRAGPRRDGGD
jgi:LAO/AO transport system kinase